MTAPADSYVWATCQLGAEAELKAEVGRRHPGWRAAFSRPGLVTWKTDAPVDAGVAVDAVLARVWGASLGRAATPAEVLALAPAEAARLHVFARAPLDRAGEPDPAAHAAADALRVALRASAGRARFAADPTAAPGDLVLDVIVAPGEPALVGVHRHAAGRWAIPGGWPELALPEGAPSRAWLKLEEAVAWAGLPLAAGQVAVEIGSAPGGASFALLGRGLTVVGVDPGDMDARVLASPRFQHLRTTMADVRREALPPRVDWLLMDVNLAPQVALHQVRRLVGLLRGGGLRGVVLTLKMNDARAFADVPALLARVAGMGLGALRATQLPANRREICVVAEAAAPAAAREPGRAARSARAPKKPARGRAGPRS